MRIIKGEKLLIISELVEAMFSVKFAGNEMNVSIIGLPRQYVALVALYGQILTWAWVRNSPNCGQYKTLYQFQTK